MDLPPPPPLPEPRSPLRFLLPLALVVSLIGNGLLVVRLRNQQDQTRRLQAQLADAQNSLSDLQGTLRSGTGDPLQRLADAVSKIRGLRFKQAVQPELLTPAQFQQRVHDDFVRTNPRAVIEATGKVLATFGVIPPSLDLYTTLDSLQEEQIAGFYDSSTKKLVVRANDVKDPSPLTRVLLAHELTHALTDQYYDLRRIDALQKQRKDDEQEAFLALAEGDAQLTMQLYTQDVLTAAEQTQLAQEFGSLPSSRLDAAPKFIQDELGFPYTAGLDFATTLHDRGGFDLVNKAYADPPTSTEQIIHPSKYLDSRDPPVAVTMPDVAAAMGSGWRKIDAGGMGELDLRDLADFGGGQGLSTEEARAAAAGWGGGRYAGVSSKSGTLVAVDCVFDSESEAREAVRDFGDWLPLRYGNVGSSFQTGSGTGSGWDSGHGAGEVLLKGSGMVLLLGPSRTDLQRARSAFPGY